MTQGAITEVIRLDPMGLGLLLQRHGMDKVPCTAQSLYALAQNDGQFRGDLIALLKKAGISLPDRTETTNTPQAPANFNGKESPKKTEQPRVFGVSKPLFLTLLVLVVVFGFVKFYKRG